MDVHRVAEPPSVFRARDPAHEFPFSEAAFGGEFSFVVRFKEVPAEGVEIPEREMDRIFEALSAVAEAGPEASLF